MKGSDAEFVVWDLKDLPEDWKTHLTVDFGSEECEKYLYGEWKVEPLDALVLYSKGNKASMKHLFGEGKIHYVNTTRLAVLDIVMGNLYREIIVFDDGVKQGDIDIAMKYRWR